MPRKTTAADPKKRTAVVEEGVSISPMPVTMGEIVTVNYDGLLAQNGATSIYTHVGYGKNDKWDYIEDIPMIKASEVWSCNILPKDARINFCFHDGANHWDNNYERNWSLTVHDGA